ncbi:hypothetical protein HAX54_037533, partial [Datura stramonium]|nr:hypothetical protein [Datura stramonium]
EGIDIWDRMLVREVGGIRWSVVPTIGRVWLSIFGSTIAGPSSLKMIELSRALIASDNSLYSRPRPIDYWNLMKSSSPFRGEPLQAKSSAKDLIFSYNR